MRGPLLFANYVSRNYGEVHDANWPHGCGRVGAIRWEVSPEGKLTLACNWADGPNFTFLRFRWNAAEGELQLDDVGVKPGG